MKTSQQSPVPSSERRHDLRRRVSSIVVVKLDDGNGGILLNLGMGGLSFQAVAGLRLEQDVSLSFGLFDTNETITVAGRVAWLGPTRKEAGVRFKELPHDTEQSIAEWMATHETIPDSAKWNVKSPVNPAPAVSEIPLPAPHVSVVPISSSGPALDTPSRGAALPSDSLLRGAPPKPSFRKPSAPIAFGAPYTPPIPTHVFHPKEHGVASAINPTAVPPEPLQPILQLEQTSSLAPPTGLLAGDPLPSDLPSPDIFENRPARQAPGYTWNGIAGNSWSYLVRRLSFLQGNRSLQVRIAVGVASFLVILALILIATSSGGRSQDVGSGAAAAASARSSSAVADVPFGAAGDPILIPPPRVVRRPAQQPWLASLKGIFGVPQDNPVLDPSGVGIAVWTDTQSGYYFCLDSPYFARFQPGSLVAQGDALQSGYQPRLGTYCQ